jgi:hypothetical protein
MCVVACGDGGGHNIITMIQLRGRSSYSSEGEVLICVFGFVEQAMAFARKCIFLERNATK